MNLIGSFKILFCSFESFACAETVNGYNDEADERQNEREVCGWEPGNCSSVDDCCLQGWQCRTAENGHNEAGGAYFSILAQALQCNAVDSGEH